MTRRDAARLDDALRATLGAGWAVKRDQAIVWLRRDCDDTDAAGLWILPGDDGGWRVVCIMLGWIRFIAPGRGWPDRAAAAVVEMIREQQ